MRKVKVSLAATTVAMIALTLVLGLAFVGCASTGGGAPTTAGPTAAVGLSSCWEKTR